MPSSFDSLSLEGRVAMVTGGSRGIGRGIVDVLAERGAAVAFSFREREEPAREVEAALRAAGHKVWTGPCDARDPQAVGTFVEQAVSALGPIDILVNNAGVSRDAHVMFLDRARWDE